MVDWKIRRRHGECSGCEAVFEDGQRLASLLRIDEEQVLLREDLCEVCWKAGDPESYLFWWFTRHHPSRSKTVQLDLGSLERLFLELEGREEGSLRELRYLLCLLLMRKRKLKLIRVLRGQEGERLILRRPRRQEELAVHVFDFTPERLEELRSRLQEVLDGAGPLAGDELPGGEEADSADEESSSDDVASDASSTSGDDASGTPSDEGFAAPSDDGFATPNDDGFATPNDDGFAVGEASPSDELSAAAAEVEGEGSKDAPVADPAVTDDLDATAAEAEPTTAS